MDNKASIRSYKDLIVYQKSYRLALDIYRATQTYPKEVIYGLVSQMRRSAVSIPCNIAEGHRRRHRKEYIQYIWLMALVGNLKLFSPCLGILGY